VGGRDEVTLKERLAEVWQTLVAVLVEVVENVQ